MKYFKIVDHSRNVSKIGLIVSPKSVLKLRHELVGQNLSGTILVLQKIVKYFKLSDHLKDTWKTNLNGPPTLVLQFETRISGTKYLTPFCFSKKS